MRALRARSPIRANGPRRALRFNLTLTLLLTLGACGGGGGTDFAPTSESATAPFPAPPRSDPTPTTPVGPPQVATAPTLLTQPGAVRVTEGQQAAFAVSAAGTEPMSFQWYRDGLPISGANLSHYALAETTFADTAAVFVVVVSNAAGSSTSEPALLTVDQAPPVLVDDQPRALTVVVGDAVTLTVQVRGSALSFQWQRDGVAIPGANAASYTLPAVSSGDQGAVYTVLVSNAAGALTSQAFVLATTAAALPPSIATGPQSLSVAEGQAASFAVVAQGTEPLNYQWFQDGLIVVGATGPNYTLSSTSPTDDGAAITVRITNDQGGTTSTAATLSVTTAPPSALPAASLHMSQTSFTTGGHLVLNGAAVIDADGSLLVTPATDSQIGSAWYSTPVSIDSATSISTRFVFRIGGGNGSGADGLVFLLQTQGTGAISAQAGGFLGYGGIAPSVAIKLDTYLNAEFGDPSNNFIGVTLDGSPVSVAHGDPGFSLIDDQTHALWIDFDGPNRRLRVYVSADPDAVRPLTPIIDTAFDLDQHFGGSAVYAGFTSSTGASYDNHRIQAWQIAAGRGPSLSQQLSVGQTLFTNQSLRATDGSHELRFESDGTLALVRTPDSQVLWTAGSSSTPMARLTLQANGELVGYDLAGIARWSTATRASGSTRLSLDPDGSLRLTWLTDDRELWRAP